MTAEEVTRALVDAVNARDPEAFSSLYAPNATVIDPQAPEPLEGRDAVRKDMEDFLRAFPDLAATTRASVASGSQYAFDGIFRGTHRGPIPTSAGEIAPTGRRIELRIASFGKLDGQGRILEDHRYFDQVSLLTQLGVLPSAPEAAAAIPNA